MRRKGGSVAQDIRRIGILTSGGDCAGLNAVIRAAAHRAIFGYGWEILGIHEGTRGLMDRPLRYEKLELKNDGTHKHVYKFRQAGNDKIILKAKATSTSAADFTFKAFKPKLFKLEIPNKQVTNFVADVVDPTPPPELGR